MRIFKPQQEVGRRSCAYGASGGSCTDAAVESVNVSWTNTITENDDRFYDMQPDACYLAKFYEVFHLASSHVVMFDHNLKLMSLEEPMIMQLRIPHSHLFILYA